MRSKHEIRKPGVWPSQRKEEGSGQSPSSTTQKDGQCAKQLVPSSERSMFFKLKEEVMKHAQSYIRGHAMAICRFLAPDHEAVKCLSVFGGKAQKFAAEILAMMGHPALEASGALLSASGAQMALHARIRANNDAYKRGIATDSHGHPLQGHPCVLPSSVGLDGRASPVLAGPYDSPPVWRSFLSNQ